MPSKKQYDLVQNDDFDTRIPLHPEEAFRHGITFQAKYIGMLDVPRPTSRVEIVAAMRRIRYEFKTKGVKKKKVTIDISVDGVKVTLRKKKKRKQWLEEGKSVLLSHPIYRIFYVSHDSQDLKIFSYIARDGASNVFKCAVFKSNKKSQAMRIVRTVGQAFEVCHKMAITAPENENDYDEQDTCTQDDGLSDITADKPKRDLTSEGASDKASLPDEHNANKDLNGMDTNNRQYHVDLLSVPTLNNNSSNNTSANNSANNTLANSNNNSHNNSNVNLFQRKSPMDTFSNPHNDNLLGGGTNLNSTLGNSGNAISAQHEIQLLREQLEQQSQQTQAAMAQLQLTREQLAAEQSARMEAQSRTHQLLVHNRELLDHIAALVAHLQGGEKIPGQQSNSPHVAMPQQSFQGMNNSPEHQDHSALDHTVLQALGLNPHDLIENPMVTSRLPSSPLRTSFNPQNNLFNFPIQDFSLETQLLQRLQTLCGYTPPQYNYMNQPLPFLSNLYGQGMVNNNYTLQPPPQKRLPPSPLAVRHSYSTSPIMDSRISPSKNDSLQNIHQVYQAQQNLQSQNYCNQNYQSNQSLNQIPQQNSQHLQVQGGPQQRQSPQRNLSPKTERSGEPQFIKPLSQMGTLTTTDTDGRVRVIVPVPSADEATNMMSQMRLEDYRPNVPTITRSTSEKVPNRSELMSQVQRTAWARHTTK